jgi:hypothetical protein
MPLDPFTGQPLPSGSTQRQEFHGRVLVGRASRRNHATDNSGMMGTLILDGDTADIRVGGNSSLSGDITLLEAPICPASPSMDNSPLFNND